MPESTSTEADPKSGTGSGMIAFINWAMRKNEILENSAIALRTGARRVLETDESLFDKDVRTLDVDETARRFRNKQRGGEFKDTSIEDYVRRFKQLVEMYIKWLDGDVSWRPPQRRTASRPGDKIENGQKKSTRSSTPVPAQATVTGLTVVDNTPGTDISGVQMVTYPYPVRLGLMAQLTLPVDLTSKEAERLAKFVASLAFDERLAITAGPAA